MESLSIDSITEITECYLYSSLCRRNNKETTIDNNNCDYDQDNVTKHLR